MTRKAAFTLCAVVDLVLVLVLSIVAQQTSNVALGYVALALLVSAVGILIMSRRN